MSREGSSIQDGCLEPFWGIAVDRRRLLAGSSFTVLVSLMPSVAWSAPYPTVQDVRLIKIIDRDHALLSLKGRSEKLKRGEANSGWTLVELIDGDYPFVVLENFDDLYAPMCTVDDLKRSPPSVWHYRFAATRVEAGQSNRDTHRA